MKSSSSILIRWVYTQQNVINQATVFHSHLKFWYYISTACFQDGAGRVYERRNKLELHRICGQSGCIGHDWEGIFSLLDELILHAYLFDHSRTFFLLLLLLLWVWLWKPQIYVLYILQKPGGVIALLDEAWYAVSFACAKVSYFHLILLVYWSWTHHHHHT